jgi:hypothetical protein
MNIFLEILTTELLSLIFSINCEALLPTKASFSTSYDEGNLQSWLLTKISEY